MTHRTFTMVTHSPTGPGLMIIVARSRDPAGESRTLRGQYPHVLWKSPSFQADRGRLTPVTASTWNSMHTNAACPAADSKLLKQNPDRLCSGEIEHGFNSAAPTHFFPGIPAPRRRSPRLQKEPLELARAMSYHSDSAAIVMNAHSVREALRSRCTNGSMRPV